MQYLGGCSSDRSSTAKKLSALVRAGWGHWLAWSGYGLAPSRYNQLVGHIQPLGFILHTLALITLMAIIMASSCPHNYCHTS